MKIKIKRFDTSLPLPEYKSPGAAALDLAARETVTIAPRTTNMIPLNIALELPPDHWVLLAARSSLHKKGLIMANGIGVGDADYCGDNDEYHAALYNLTDQPVTIERGERITQMIVLPVERAELEEVKHLGNKDRGGFGSTGK
ncbi:MAG TPA: dUTP diphosphatase [Patescibacteria group bacterium]